MENTLSYRAYLKSPYKSTKHTTYFDVYDSLLCRYIGTDLTFVEIGVLGGGSLFMWREFFGPKARIIGIDLNPNAKKWEKDGFEIYIGSQSDEDFWEKFTKAVGMVDVVLDDGGHTYLQQIVTCEMMFDGIKEKGMLIVEDTHTSYLPGFGPRGYSFIKYVKNIIDKMNGRSGKLNSIALEKRVWSVQLFDSVVAFHIDRKASYLPSESTSNNGMDDSAVDFRHHENTLFSTYNSAYKKVATRFRFLKNIVGVRRTALLIRNFIGNKTGSTKQLKKYFKHTPYFKKISDR
jgi:hypothetical protein